MIDVYLLEIFEAIFSIKHKSVGIFMFNTYLLDIYFNN